MKSISDLPLALSSSFFPSASPELLRECKACGIKALELSLSSCLPRMENDIIQQHWRELIAAAGQAGITLWSAHLPFCDPYDLAAFSAGRNRYQSYRRPPLLRADPPGRPVAANRGQQAVATRFSGGGRLLWRTDSGRMPAAHLPGQQY